MNDFERDSTRGYIQVEALRPGDSFTYPDGQAGFWTVEIQEERRVSNAFGIPRHEAVITRRIQETDQEDKFVGLLLGVTETFYMGDVRSLTISQYVPADFDEYEALALEVLDENGDLSVRTLHPIGTEE